MVEATAGDEQQPNLYICSERVALDEELRLSFSLGYQSHVASIPCKEYCGHIAGCLPARERTWGYIAKHDTIWSTPLPMERLPTELVIQILSYASNKQLKVIGFLSSEYRSLVIPFLFRHIRLWSEARARDIDGLVTRLQNNVRLSSAVRVLDAEHIIGSQHPVEDLRRIMEITTRWEELVLPIDDHRLLAVLDNNTVHPMSLVHRSQILSPSLRYTPYLHEPGRNMDACSKGGDDQGH